MSHKRRSKRPARKGSSPRPPVAQVPRPQVVAPTNHERPVTPQSPARPPGRSKTIAAAALGAAVVLAIAFGLWRVIIRDRGSPRRDDATLPALPSRGLFTDVTKEAGITFLHTTGQKTGRMLYPEIMGAGMILFDYDNDDDLDIFFVNGNYIRGRKPDPKISDVLYRNDTPPGGKWRFTDVTEEAGVADSAYGQGGEAADFDNDGDQDLYVTNLGPNVYFRNEGNGKFTRLPILAQDGWGQCASALDYDSDGDLDLYVVNYLTYDPDKQDLGISTVAGQLIHEYHGPQVYQGSPDVLYRNNGDGTFTDVTRQVGLYSPRGKGMGLAIADYDNDGDPDIFVANDMMVNYLFENFGGRFVERGVEAGVATDANGNVESSMGVDVADVDSDGLFDIMVPCRHRESHTLYHNEWPLFSDASVERGLDEATLGYTGFSPNFLDYDNDGDVDLYVTTGEVVTLEAAVRKGFTKPEHFQERYAQPDLLLENNGRGYFRRVSPERLGPYFKRRTVARGSAAGDLDNDGDVDLVINTSEGRPVLLRNMVNEQRKGGHWLTLKLIGTKSNRDAIGARVTARTGGKVQYHYLRGGGSYLSVNDRRIHLGLGEATVVDTIEIAWPSGTKQTLEKVQPVNRILTIREGQQT